MRGQSIINPTTGKVNPKYRINPHQFLFTAPQYAKLVSNHQQSQRDSFGNLPPVVKLFGGCAGTWLLSELDPETGHAFGLCDPGLGFPEIGYVDLQELVDVRFPPFGLYIERDLHFVGTQPMSYYDDKARAVGHIVSC